jgi:hypothetical protein
MRWAVLLLLGSCYSPHLAPCSVTCGPGSPCPDDLSCGADARCHAAGDSQACPAALSITTDGNGAGHVTSTPVGVDCDSSSSGAGCDDISFAAGTMVVLTESHTSGNTFVGWSGDACAGSTQTTCTFRLDHPMTVNARFE